MELPPPTRNHGVTLLRTWWRPRDARANHEAVSFISAFVWPVSGNFGGEEDQKTRITRMRTRAGTAARRASTGGSPG